ncbi:MAG: TonB-dependent receptor [Candidatus Marinimicrobia bacterium]|nr:TonB-dependent receptor [Candidatus Neomarinimicrobiota bacterium]
MMKNRLYSKCLFIMMMTSMSFSQSGKVTGIVQDGSTGQPIQYASVSVLRMSDEKIETGRITDHFGSFTIHEIPEGRYRLEVEFIGYKSYVSSVFFLQDGDEIDMGTVSLELTVLAGADVDVTAERPLQQVEVDKKVYNIEQLKTTAAGTCCDVLKKIPSLDVGLDGTVSLRGTSNVTILIDEKRAGMLGGERKTNAVAIPVPASMIDRIEIITSPSAKYDPDGMSGIVNIILKDEVQQGYNSELSVNGGHTGKMTTGGLVNYRRKNVNMYIKGNLDIVQMAGNGTRDILLSDSNDVLIYKSNETSQMQTTHSVNFLNAGIKYHISKESQLTLDSKFTRSGKLLNDSTFYDLNGFQLNKSIKKEGDHRGLHQSYMINYTNQYNDNAFINADVTHDIYTETSTQDYYLNSIMDRQIEFDLSKMYSIIKVDHFYSRNENFVTESGYKGRFLSIKKQYGSIPSPFHFRYVENIHALYRTVNYNISESFSIKPGLRFEWVTSTVESSIDDSTHLSSNPFSFETGKITDDYFEIYPTFNASLKLNPYSNIHFGYGKRVNRPEFHALDPFPKHFFYSSIDTVGNPDLKPEFIHAFEMGYTALKNLYKFNGSVYYQAISDLIMWDEGLVSDSLSLYSFENYGDGTLYGAEFNVKVSPMVNWEVTLGVNPFRYDVYTENNDHEYYEGAVFRVVNTINFVRIGKIELNGSYHSPHSLSTGSIWPNGKVNLDLALQRSFLSEKLMLTVKVTDAFNKDHYERSIRGFDKQINLKSDINTYRKYDEPTIYLAVQYKFGDIGVL